MALLRRLAGLTKIVVAIKFAKDPGVFGRPFVSLLVAALAGSIGGPAHEYCVGRLLNLLVVALASPLVGVPDQHGANPLVSLLYLLLQLHLGTCS